MTDEVPAGFTEEQIEAARKTFAGPIAFLKSAPTLEYIPDPIVNEVAFAGRSNVGKSSLLNALAGRKALARTSVTPGRTQELNFFDVGEAAFVPPRRHARLRLRQGAQGRRPQVALPGQRLPARAAGAETPLVLIDSRHGIKVVEPRDPRDARQGRGQLPHGPDQGGQDQGDRPRRVTQRTTDEARKRAAAHPDILVTSSDTGLGIAELRAAVIEAVA